jgi:hypothetical protein
MKAATETAPDPRDADDWFQTFTGRRFPINHPKPELVDIVDIAHALAHICRYGGHCRRFYSVAEHSVMIATYARDVEHRSKAQVRHALLHDAAEAYTGDIKRPVKNAVPAIRQAVRKVEAVVAGALGIPIDKPQWLVDLDTRIVADEKTALLGHPRDGTLWGHEARGILPLGMTVHGWVPEHAKAYFLNFYQEIA